MSASRPRRRVAERASRAWEAEMENEEEYFSAEEGDERGGGDEAYDDAAHRRFEAEEDAEDADQQPAKRAAKRAKAAPKRKTPGRVKAEGGRRGGTFGSGGGGGSGSGGALEAQRIQLERGDLSTMRAKIAQYQQAATDAETKLATLVSATESDELVASVVRMMLFRQHEKPGVPVKRQELLETCLSEYTKAHRHGRQLPPLVLKVAQARMVSRLGIEMAEVARVAAPGAGDARRKKPTGAPAGDEKSVTQTYVLRSVLPPVIRRALVDDPADDAAQGLKMVVLALIHLNGGRIEEEELWRHLRMLGVGQEDHDHPQFGRPADALRELEKTRHIVRGQQSSANGAVPVVEGGEAAASEFGPGGVEEWIEREFAAAPGFGPGRAGGGGGGGAPIAAGGE